MEQQHKVTKTEAVSRQETPTRGHCGESHYNHYQRNKHNSGTRTNGQNNTYDTTQTIRNPRGTGLELDFFY